MVLSVLLVPLPRPARGPVAKLEPRLPWLLATVYQDPKSEEKPSTTRQGSYSTRTVADSSGPRAKASMTPPPRLRASGSLASGYGRNFSQQAGHQPGLLLDLILVCPVHVIRFSSSHLASCGAADHHRHAHSAVRQDLRFKSR